MNKKNQLNASSRIMYDEALKMGIQCTTFGDNETILMETYERKWYVRGSRTSLQSSVGKTIADYKPLTKAVLKHFELPTAKYVHVQNKEELQQISELTYPIVMKPVNGRHGKNVIVGIQSYDEAASIYDKQQEKNMIFEEQLQGVEYRIVCVNYSFIAAALRKPAHVIGDGKKSVRELIEEKNAHPWRGDGHQNNLTRITVDEIVEKNLIEQQLSVDSVPKVGVEVTLRKTANLSTGGEAWDVTDEVCPENKVLFEKIASACDLHIVGIDIMCNNLRKPIQSQEKAGVIEVNASPGLRMHHFPIQGKTRNVAKEIILSAIK